MKSKLLNARLNKGFSQEQLADLIGMTQSNYCRREKGLKKISDAEWIKIAKELNVKKEDIYEVDILTKNDSNSKDIVSWKLYHFNIPDFVIEHMEFLKKENKELREQLRKDAL
ncbi:helix-turn-helix transcriptional regulator [Flavobacterium sp. JAS]|uniref:helix-turn-helix transcriptional regulator n=1 Tax=Flavobacterium sp. JAS TaxID=2897329 RepID=UPI001E2A9C92|nr:helix-turn-helix transcriptional regulator [Flavobacterium sp. JAS]MCD0472675.1 helix-turn-helix domain-containing protein [Flavobacterium sp. JAS]